MKLKIIFVVILFSVVFSSLFAQNKAKNYLEYLRKNPYTYSKDYLPQLNELKRFSVTFADIRERQGYYIQNHNRYFQENGRSPIIFKLYESDEKFFLAQIDVKDLKEIVLSQSELIQTGVFVETKDNQYRIAREGSDLFIFSSDDNDNSWAFRRPFTYQTNLKGLLDCAPVMKMTSDYLKKFVGQYNFDSFVSYSEGTSYETKKNASRIFTITYDNENKALMWSTEDFIETDFSEPFYWTYSEGAGYRTTFYTFVDNGILTYNRSYTHHMSDGTSDDTELCIFYKKEMSEPYKPHRKTQTNLRIREFPDLKNGTVLVSLKEGSVVTIIQNGHPDYIDRMIGNWVKVSIAAGTNDNDGKPIQNEITGWCFDGYLSKP